ncbi:MAG: hypothetical protein H6981_06110 [Gammaproteobacteria bacterium]|nr:hypothetical protein [Gammaproteobacteria bacterium]
MFALIGLMASFIAIYKLSLPKDQLLEVHPVFATVAQTVLQWPAIVLGLLLVGLFVWGKKTGVIEPSDWSFTRGLLRVLHGLPIWVSGSLALTLMVVSMGISWFLLKGNLPFF